MNTTHSYRGKLQLDETELLEVDLRVAGGEVILLARSGSLGVWSIDDVGVVRVGGDQFRLDLDGEQATFFADDVIAFSYEGLPALAKTSRFAGLRRSLRRHRRAEDPRTPTRDVPVPKMAQEVSVGEVPVGKAPIRRVVTETAWMNRVREKRVAPKPVRREVNGPAPATEVAVPSSAPQLGAALAAVSRVARDGLRTTTTAAAGGIRRSREALAAARARRHQAKDDRQREPIEPPPAVEERPPVGVGRDRRQLAGSLPALARTSGKAMFAAADLFLGRWPGPRILIYHQVGTETGRQMEVTEDAFLAHVRWMQGHGTIVALEDALLRRGSADSDRLFVITFDDGYADLFEVAYPRLLAAGVPFTLYLTTAHVESGMPLAAGRPPLAWEQISKMVDGGLMTLGAHTHRHADLRTASLDQVEEELSASDELIEERTGVTPLHFAYPWGHWSPVADTVVRRRYDSAVLGAGHPITASTDPYLIHRLPIQRSDGVAYFKRKAIRGMRLEETARRLLRGYRGP
ncbi:MAG TPA: polysaccharide deacetylase family protein [Acidimicrobiia bacterium]|nr:polysaccharide deacetylase family protein [Acidimicrobiia bacterium]